MSEPEIINGWTLITGQRATAWGRGNKQWTLMLLDDEGIDSAVLVFDRKKDMLNFANSNPVQAPGPRTVTGKTREARLKTKEILKASAEKMALQPRRSRRQFR